MPNSEGHFSPEEAEHWEAEETNETLKRSPDARLTFFRHGEANYEYVEGEGKFDGPLKEEGRKRVEDAAKEFAQSVEPENEIIVIWSSPFQRTLETADIIMQELEKRGIKIIRSSPKPVDSLAMSRITEEYGQRAMELGFANHYAVFLDESESGTLPEGVESAEKIHKREKRWLEYARRASKNVKPENNKKLHIVAVGHETSVDKLLTSTFDRSVTQGGGTKNAEKVEIDFYNDSEDFTVHFAGETAVVRQDPKSREFERQDGRT